MSATVPPATAPTTEPGVKTFRGESLEELRPQIREELGADAVILRQRDGLKGGVGGFFQKRCVEVDARAGAPRVDTYAGAATDDDDVRSALDQDPADFARQLDAAQCEALLARAAARKLGATMQLALTDASATDGWNLATRGYLAHAANVAPGGAPRDQRQQQLAW